MAHRVADSATEAHAIVGVGNKAAPHRVTVILGAVHGKLVTELVEIDGGEHVDDEDSKHDLLNVRG